MTPLEPSRLRSGDLVALGVHGLRARPGRTVLSALGVAIGIAAMLAVFSISEASHARVQAELEALGTNLLTIEPNTKLSKDVEFDPAAPDAVANLPGVDSVSSTGVLEDVHVYRNEHIDPNATGSIAVAAADPGLLDTTRTGLSVGRWLDDATSALPTVVLGDAAATHLGVRSVGEQVLLGGEPFTVVGVLEPSKLTPELDLHALIGAPVAADRFEFSGSPTRIYERSADDRVDEVRDKLAATVMPLAPGSVKISKPSDALAAKESVDRANTGLLAGIGSIALVVGGIGVANTMVITVLERRVEIGLRRSLGATRRHIAAQFVVEATLLAALGGLVGIVVGLGVGAVVALVNAWPPSVPPLAIAGAFVATLLVGAVAGALPASRAARTPPTVVMAA